MRRQPIGIPLTGANILYLQPCLLFQKGFRCVARCQHCQNRLCRKPSPAKDRFSAEDAGINRDAFQQIRFRRGCHDVSLSFVAALRVPPGIIQPSRFYYTADPPRKTRPGRCHSSASCPAKAKGRFAALPRRAERSIAVLLSTAASVCLVRFPVQCCQTHFKRFENYFQALFSDIEAIFYDVKTIFSDIKAIFQEVEAVRYYEKAVENRFQSVATNAVTGKRRVAALRQSKKHVRSSEIRSACANSSAGRNARQPRRTLQSTADRINGNHRIFQDTLQKQPA